MATQTDGVQSIFNEVGSSSKVEESDAVSISPRRCSRPARSLRFYVGNSRSKCTKERGRLQNLEKKSVAHEKVTTGPGGKADIFPEDYQKGTDVQADGNKGREVEAFIAEEDEETQLALKDERSLLRHPLRKQSPPVVDEQLAIKQHSTHQNVNHVEQNISTIDTKAGISKQMMQEPQKLLDDNILSHPRKRKLKCANFTPTKNSKVPEVQPRRTKQQSELNSSHVMRVENLLGDSKNIMDVKEIMKDMSKLLPHIVLQRVSFPGIAAPSKIQLAEQHESFANHPKEELYGAEAASSLKEGGNATSAKLGSDDPIEENCVILDVFLSAEKKEEERKSKSTVIVQSQTEPAVVHDEAIFKEKNCVSEKNEDSVATDGPAVILDVNLDICVEGGGHVELHDVKITDRKRSLSCQEEEKISPEVKPLRGRRGRTPKAMTVEPVRIQRRIANSKKKLAEPSLHPLHSSNGTDVTKKREATQGLVVTAKENVVHEKVKAISVGKGSLAEEEILNESVAGLPDNIGVAKENYVDAVSSIANEEENKTVDLEEAASNEEVYLLTEVKPPKIRRGRGGRVKIASRERTTGKIKNVSGQSSDAETSISSEVAQQTNMEKSPALTANTSLCIEKATSSSEIQLSLNLFVQMTRVPEVEALAAAMKLEGSKTSAKRPRRNVTDPSTSPGTELSTESSSAAIGLKQVRKKKKFF